MPSTFTSNTGIELIADGEQTGAWGQTTNDNFDIVDRALNGSVSIALSGTTHTLTTADGVLSDGQAAVLVFTGSPSGTNTVTIAPNTAQKTYFVTNSTAQTVVLSQGSGANVSVPAGLSKIVFTNGAGAGAAVFDITNTLSGNLTGNAGTATALQTARTLTIGGTGKTFNGTANVAWSLAEIGVNNATLTLATSGIATGSQTFTANQGTAATFTVNVPATNLSVTAGTTAGPVINSSTGTNVTFPTASGTASGAVTTGNQTWAGTKTFSSAVVLSTAGTATTHAVRADRTITTGTGILGGGDLTANRTFSIDIASQAEAEAGTDNAHVMTPLRVKQSIDALASGGATELLSRTVISGSPTTIEFTFNETLFDQIYFVLSNVRVTDGGRIHARTSANGGSTFDSASGSYRLVRLQQTGTNIAATSSALNVHEIADDMGAAAGEDGASGTFSVFGPSVTSTTSLHSDVSFVSASGVSIQVRNFGRRNSSDIVNAIQFIGNTFLSGVITMYGVRNS